VLCAAAHKTYIRTWSGFGYIAFAIDLYSRAIVGWSASNTKDVTFVEQCLSFMGLFKNEAIAAGSPFRTGPLRTLSDVETLTMNYVDWSPTTASTAAWGTSLSFVVRPSARLRAT